MNFCMGYLVLNLSNKKIDFEINLEELIVLCMHSILYGINNRSL